LIRLSYLQTGQVKCYDSSGHEISCSGSGQDGEFKKGISWPVPRFERKDRTTVVDHLTGLMWTGDANIFEFPMTWQESLDYVTDMNRDRVFGYADWRLPNRRELRSLLSYQTCNPVLPQEHPFRNVFNGWYWTSTTAAINTAYAWYIHMGGGRMFYGGKRQYFLLWPVRGLDSNNLLATGQNRCYDTQGEEISCINSGHDGEFCLGRSWPKPRFEVHDDRVFDRLTGLEWMKKADLTAAPVTWSDALKAVKHYNQSAKGKSIWRLPHINELESVVDCSMHSPALTAEHPFTELHDVYWSSTSSFFETDWAWALYLNKGATGVGHKRDAQFSVWPVCDAPQ
jgi:hypothetical protein